MPRKFEILMADDETQTSTSATDPDVAEMAATSAEGVRKVDEPPIVDSAAAKRRLRIGAVLGALLVVTSIASAVFFYLRFETKRDILAAQESAREAACAYAPALANYDFTNLDPYFESVLDGATGDWKTQFAGNSTELRNVLVRGQVKSRVDDVQCAIESGNGDRADTIVVIGQSITSVGTEGKPQPSQITMVITVDNVDGRWMVSTLDSPQLVR